MQNLAEFHYTTVLAYYRQTKKTVSVLEEFKIENLGKAEKENQSRPVESEVNQNDVSNKT